MELHIVGAEPERAAAPAAPLASVRVTFENLPPESRLKLDDALRGWAAWHADKYVEGYVPPQVVSGSLGYDPARMHLQGGGAIAWEERPAPPAQNGANTLWFNIAYEKAGDVPRYDRSASVQLHSKRKLAAAAEGLLAADEAEGVGKPVKRQRGTNRCFNCGSYGHSVRECWKEQDRAAVEEARREQSESSAWAGRSSAARYYQAAGGPGGGAGGAGGGAIAAEREKGEFEGLAPGQLSAELRAAMGIGELAPPPWLHRMRELGLPPGYMREVPAAAASAGASATGAAGAAAAGAGAAAGEARPRQPPAPTAAAAAAADGELEDFISLPDSPGDAAAAAAAADGGSAVPPRLECSVHFPGVNAPAPEGADPVAWAPQPALHAPALPPGFGTPPPAGGSWQAAAGSAGRGSGGTANLHPLRGLHPPRQAASEGSLPAAAAAQQQPQPQQAQQQQQTYQQAPQYTPPLPGPRHGAPVRELAVAAAQQAQLPPGFGLQAAHPSSQQHHQQHAQHAQQMQHGVCTVSRSDPGHLLAVAVASGNAGHRVQQGGGQAVAHAPRLQGWAQPVVTPVAYPPHQHQQVQPVFFMPGLQQAGVQLYAAPQQHHEQQQQQHHHHQQQVPQYMPGQHAHAAGGNGYSPHQAASQPGYGQQSGGYGNGSGGGWRMPEAPPPQHPSAEQRRQLEEQQQRLWEGSGR